MNNPCRLVSLDQLRHFVALAEAKHFSRAARSCNITQPPFSRSIARLESTLNVCLVLRTKRSVELTDAGLLFAERAFHALAVLDEAVDRVSLLAKVPHS